MDLGLIVTFAGVIVAGIAGVLGVWMERDSDAPPKWAWVFSVLIVVATGVELSHSTVAASEEGETDEAMARVLGQLAVLSQNGGNPALSSFVDSELAAQARNNPKLMDKVAKKAGTDANSLKKRAAVGARKSAGLPARRPAGMGARPGAKGGKAMPGKGGKSKSGGAGKGSADTAA